jgi:hypothetical protein
MPWYRGATDLQREELRDVKCVVTQETFVRNIVCQAFIKDSRDILYIQGPNLGCKE